MVFNTLKNLKIMTKNFKILFSNNVLTSWYLTAKNGKI